MNCNPSNPHIVCTYHDMVRGVNHTLPLPPIETHIVRDIILFAVLVAVFVTTTRIAAWLIVWHDTRDHVRPARPARVLVGMS